MQPSRIKSGKEQSLLNTRTDPGKFGTLLAEQVAETRGHGLDGCGCGIHNGAEGVQ
jgi:hypothetical protein